jgi:hypothetical protein
MKTKYFTTFAVAISFLVATNVKADVITSIMHCSNTNIGLQAFDNSQIADYFAVAGSSDWVFGNFQSADKHHHNFSFNVTNTETKEVVLGTLASGQHTGNAGGFLDSAFDRGVAAGTVALSHNTSTWSTMSFVLDAVESFANSFYVYFDTHRNSMDGWINMVATVSDGSTVTLSQQAFATTAFFGFTVDEGLHFTGFEITVTDEQGVSKNNGGFHNLMVGFGDSGWNTYVPELPVITPPGEPGDSAVPAPATLAIVGLGLAGLGFARARRNKKAA